MKKWLLVVCLVAGLAVPRAQADEGMWLLPYLKELILEDMQKMGLELSAEQIYSINQASLKDAVAMFGGGCTGEMVSPEGLLLTNHHCGIDEFQRLSTPENDYLKDGFWAMSREQEVPVPGLSVNFLVRIEDVTQQVLEAATDEMSATERSRAIRMQRRVLERQASEGGRYRGSVEFFRPGSTGQYLLFVYQEYSDVRMVGVPPENIGQFGGDADNWEWPNQNGDFALFRVYMQPDGAPAAFYDPDNVPYQPGHHFPISLEGLRKDDFVMIMGYPGSTTRYLTSYEIADIMQTSNTLRAEIRGLRQDIWKQAMEADDEIRIKYASRYFSSSNYWKYSIGQNQALENLQVVQDVQKLEERFRQWVEETATQETYGKALPMIEYAVTNRQATTRSHLILTEGFLASQSYMASGRRFNTLYNQLTADQPDEEAIRRQLKALGSSLDFFFQYDMPTERKVLEVMLGYVKEQLPQEHLPKYYQVIDQKYKGDHDLFIEDLFSTSILTDRGRMEAFLEDPDPRVLVKDPGFGFANSVYDQSIALRQHTNKINSRYLSPAKRLWYAGLEKMITERPLYPDANFTMRLTYGKVMGYEPRDGVAYQYFSTHQGILEKVYNEPGTYSTQPGLVELLEQGDFGHYGEDDLLKVSFLSDTDITGGNSGSPVLNRRGELVGVAYDGNWEAMSSDIAFAPRMQRTISVDIRYVLFIIEKYARAGYLLEEMTILKPGAESVETL